jgi:transcriptional regulator with XRE-family HTH domain
MLTPIRRIRLELGKQQYRIAQESGLHPSRLSLIESARVQPRPGELQALARALGVTVELLAG